MAERIVTADARDTAWRIHAAIVDWTGKVDAKASFALAIESAALAGIVTLTGSGRRLDGLAGWEVGLFWTGITILLAAVLSSITVVAPRLRSTKLPSEWQNNYVYFGHLMHWDAEDLQKAFEEGDPLPVVTRNIVAMSKIAWSKHRRLQVSLWLATFGTSLVGVAAMVNG
jgi:hypothetical protein